MTSPSDRNGQPPLRVLRTEAKCPICSKPSETKYRPFCSKRCADIDLGRWLKEGYRVPTEETPGDGPDEMPRRPTGQER
jgi:endogenous inhibitor of DNA gyrase (YacG/DUF329 family)